MATQETSTAVAVTDGAGPLAAFGMDQGRYKLLRQTFAKGVNDEAQVLAALEVAAKYDLDPLAKGEIWCADDKRGGVLLMVGRDGLRKIAQRAGLSADCDVVRAKDDFRVVRTPDRQRSVHHEYKGSTDVRGEIVGAWCEVWDTESGEQRGYYYAPLSEWKPTSEGKLKYSPWGSQTSVMILAAAERQALRQATPLGGLMTEGEMHLNDEIASQITDGEDESPVYIVDEALLALLSEACDDEVLTRAGVDGLLVAHGAQTTETVEKALASMPLEAQKTVRHTVADMIAAQDTAEDTTDAVEVVA